MASYSDEAMERIIDGYICPEGKPWFKAQPSYREAWARCPYPWWMIEFLRRIDYDDQRSLRTFACRCIRETPLGATGLVIDLLTDEVGRSALLTAERYIATGCSESDLATARMAAEERARVFLGDPAERFMLMAAAHAASKTASSAARSTPKSIHRALRKVTADNQTALENAVIVQTGILREYISYDDVSSLIKCKVR